MLRLYYIVFLLFPLVLTAQVEEHIRTGNKLYKNGEFTKAEDAYNKALTEDAKSYEGAFNLGDSYFRQEKYEEASTQFESIAAKAKDPITKSWAYHNQGNSLLQSKKLDESIEAYKNALRSNPNNDAARYNLSYALQLKNQQQQQEEQNEDQENKDEDNQKENKDKEENKDGEKDEENKKQQEEEDGDEDEDKEQQNKNEEGEEKEQKDQPQQLSKEDANRLLEAQKNQEQKTQEKLRELKAKGKKVKIEKDW